MVGVDIVIPVKEILSLDQRTSQNLTVCYKKGDIRMDVIYAIDKKDFYITFKINETKSYDKLLHTANYINEGKFYDEEELMKIILEYINASLDDYQKTQGDSKGAKVPGGDKGVKRLKPNTIIKGDDNNTNAKGLTTDTSAHHGDYYGGQLIFPLFVLFILRGQYFGSSRAILKTISNVCISLNRAYRVVSGTRIERLENAPWRMGC